MEVEKNVNMIDVKYVVRADENTLHNGYALVSGDAACGIPTSMFTEKVTLPTLMK